jgi:hypothetical protein
MGPLSIEQYSVIPGQLSVQISTLRQQSADGWHVREHCGRPRLIDQSISQLSLTKVGQTWPDLGPT